MPFTVERDDHGNSTRVANGARHYVAITLRCNLFDAWAERPERRDRYLAVIRPNFRELFRTGNQASHRRIGRRLHSVCYA